MLVKSFQANALLHSSTLISFTFHDQKHNYMKKWLFLLHVYVFLYFIGCNQEPQRSGNGQSKQVNWPRTKDSRFNPQLTDKTDIDRSVQQGTVLKKQALLRQFKLLRLILIGLFNKEQPSKNKRMPLRAASTRYSLVKGERIVRSVLTARLRA